MLTNYVTNEHRKILKLRLLEDMKMLSINNEGKQNKINTN